MALGAWFRKRQLWRNRLLVQFIAMLCLLVAIVEAQRKQEQAVSSVPPCTCNKRDLLPTIWGALVTTAALGLDYWATSKRSAFYGAVGRVNYLVALACMPLFYPGYIVVVRLSKAWALSQMFEERMLARRKWASLNLGEKQRLIDGKKQMRILKSCNVYADMEVWREYFTLRGSLDMDARIYRESIEWPRVEWNNPTVRQGQIRHDAWKLNDNGKLICLELGLVPHVEELTFLRTRGGVATAIATIQAAGYLATSIERVAQKLAISPIEGLATIFSVLVLLQGILSCVVTTSCQRSLIIHLSADNVEQINSAVRPLDRSRKEKWGFIGTMAFVAVAFRLSMPYYAVHLMTIKHHCLICSITALLFLLYLLATLCVLCLMYIYGQALELALELIAPPRELIAPLIAVVTFMIVSMILYVSTYIMALVATIVEWERFQTEGKPIIQWMIPHIG